MSETAEIGFVVVKEDSMNDTWKARLPVKYARDRVDARKYASDQNRAQKKRKGGQRYHYLVFPVKEL